MSKSGSSNSGGQLSGGRRALFAGILLLGTSLFLLLFLEVAAFFVLKSQYGYDGEHLMNYGFDPYKNIQPTPNYEDTRGIRHNAQGFRRDTDTPEAKPQDTLRVFLMGGSTGYGLGSLSRHGVEDFEIIRNDETIDAYLEEQLRDAVPGKRVEVINAAITSFYSHHHLIYLNQQVLKFDPDVIVFLDGFNDYFPTDPGFDQWRDYGYQERAHVFMGEPSVKALAYYTGWWLFRKSHLANWAGRIVKNLPFLFAADDGGERLVMDVPQSLRNLEANARSNWMDMVARNSLILRHEGVDGLFALQPEIAFEQSKAFAPLENKILDEMRNYWPVGYIEFKNRARPLVLDWLAESAATGGAKTVDLTDIYADLEAAAYTDYCHLTPDGNRVLAESVAPRVASLLRARVMRSGAQRNP